MSACPDCTDLLLERKRSHAFISQLIEELSVFSKRLRCDALTGEGTRCTRHPWTVRDGRPVCMSHKRAKNVRFTP